MILAQKADVVKPKADTTLSRFRPTGIRIGTDLISLAKSNYVKSFTGWEINSDIDFGRYYLAFDYGSWGRTFHPDSAQYNNNGKYFRTGIDVNFLTKDPDKNMFFIGFRYGHSVFSEHLSFTKTNTIDYHPYNNNNIKAHWLELTSGIRVKMWRFIWMGYTARFKFGLKTGNTEELIVSDVPGFGRTNKDVTWGFNYHIFIRLPLPKKN